MSDHTNIQYECYSCSEKDAEIERLTDEIINLEALAKDRYCTMQTEIERLKGDIQILKLQRDATHVSRCPRCAALDTVDSDEKEHRCPQCDRPCSGVGGDLCLKCTAALEQESK